SMVKMFTSGAPLFGSPDLFVSSMQGKGMLGPILMGMGLQPVVFKSNNQLKQQMSTESKVFSIYSTGHVNSGGRKTHIKMQVVVDFRGAPAPGVNMAALQTAQAAQNAISQATGAGALATSPTPAGSQPSGIAQAISAVMKPSPGGNVLYFRMD